MLVIKDCRKSPGSLLSHYPHNVHTVVVKANNQLLVGTWYR